MNKKIKILSEVLDFIMLAGCNSINNHPSSNDQEKIAKLIQIGIHYYWNGGVFQEAANLKELNIEYSNLVIYRDLIRTSGIWAYSGI